MFPTWSLFNFLARRLTTAWVQLLYSVQSIAVYLAPWAFNLFYELNLFRPKPARPTKPRPNSSIVAGSGTFV